MIYTVTLSPSIDYIVHFGAQSMRFNTTNRTESEEYYYGGKGINVSQVLAQLDLDSTALGFIAGFTGDAIENGIRNSRIRTDFIRLSEGFTRINVKIKAGGETEINGQGPNIPPEALEALMGKLDNLRDGDTLVLAGSIPKTCPDDVYERMLERVQHKNIMFAVDATRQLLVNSLSKHPFLIKPNRLELTEIFHKEVETQDDVIKYAGKLQEMGARNVIVSLGRRGAVLLDENGGVHTCGTLKQPVLNTVGAGDSMVAGFIAGYQKTGDYGYALKLGSACGNATSFLPGLATRAKIDEVFAQLK
ncbi:MAG: 1-phosphofructokinase [Ruminococcus sp.]|nr:1-phosphofructokinase [Ruminococcus sp.]